MFRTATRTLTLALMLTSAFAAAEGNGPPAFLSGEVAVYATPAQLSGLSVKKVLPHAGISVLSVAPGQEMGMVQRLRARGMRAGLNRLAMASFAPNDAYYPHQWHLGRIQSEAAWDLNRGEGVTVAVLDTGLATGGTDGIGCTVAGYDMVNGDTDPTDGNGHGTHVSGTVAQATNNGSGVAGVAHGACVMPVKVLNDAGSGSFADIADGIHFAVDNGASVINMSLGINARYGITNDTIMDPALDYANSRGTTVVAAAGNDGSRKNVSYPAIYPSVIAVGATDARDQVTRYSNKGTGLDLVAPGGDTSRDSDGDGYADGVLQETIRDGAWGYYFYQGTSMASPHVAGAAALLISNGTASTPEEVFQALAGSSKDLGDSGYDKQYGHGLIQLHDALTGMGGGGGEPPPSCTDADGDGYCAADDCDDNNAKIHPGANDSRGKAGRDGIDNDCNGIIDG